MAYQRRVVDALPLIQSLPASTLELLGKAAGVENDIQTLPTLPVANLRADQLQSLARTFADIPTSYLEEPPLGDILPALYLLDGGGIVAGDVSVRLFNLLRVNNATDWERIRLLSLKELLAMRNMGRQSALELLRLAAQRSLYAAARDESALPLAPEAVSQNPPKEVAMPPATGQALAVADKDLLAAFRTISAWAAGEHSATSIVQALDLACSWQSLPIEVRAARDAVLAVRPTVLGAEEFPKYDVASSVERLLSELDNRETVVLLSRSFALVPRTTLDMLAIRFGVTRERIRQVESSGMRSVGNLLRRAEYDVVHREAERLRRRLGTVARTESLPALALQIIDDASAPDRLIAQSLLLLWLAGPYQLHRGWLVLDPLDDLELRTTEVLLSCSVRGIIDLDRARDGLFALGVSEDVQRDWVGSIGGFRFIDPYLAVWNGSAADKAAVVLEINQRAMTVDELASVVGRTHGTMINAIAGDARFRRLGPHHFGLNDWRGDEYGGIVHELVEEIQRQDGAAEVKDLVATISTKFGVSESSVRAFASDPRFARTSPGTLSIRPDSGAPIDTHAIRHDSGTPIARQIEKTKRCFQLSGKWAYRLTITADTLRGSGVAIPITVAVHVGLAPQGQIALKSHFGEVRFTWPSVQPTVGSLRHVVEALGGHWGDYLFIRFSSPGRLDCTLVRHDDIAGALGIDRLSLEVGWTGHDGRSDAVSGIAAALGINETPASVALLRRRLVERGELDLADLISNIPSQTQPFNLAHDNPGGKRSLASASGDNVSPA